MIGFQHNPNCLCGCHLAVGVVGRPFGMYDYVTSTTAPKECGERTLMEDRDKIIADGAVYYRFDTRDGRVDVAYLLDEIPQEA